MDAAEVVEAAADALARVGGRAAVQRLKEVRANFGRDDRVRTSVEVAIELIQDRLAGRPGAVSLAEDDQQGKVSLAGQGELSLFDK